MTVFEDDSLPHQIRLFFSGHDTAVSCTCLGRRGAPGKIIIASGPSLPAHEAMAAYRQWHIDHGEKVRP